MRTTFLNYKKALPIQISKMNYNENLFLINKTEII